MRELISRKSMYLYRNTKYNQKTGKQAYNHPRFGYKMFLKSKKTLEELLNENEIYEKNYKMNRNLALPENIPSYISKEIIQDFKDAKAEADYECLTKYFTENRLIELISQIILL